MWLVVRGYDDFSNVGLALGKVYTSLEVAAEELLNAEAIFTVFEGVDDAYRSLEAGETGIIHIRPEHKEATRTEQQVYDELSLLYAEREYDQAVVDIHRHYENIQRYIKLQNNDVEDYEVEWYFNQYRGYKAQWENLPEKLPDDIHSKAIQEGAKWDSWHRERLAASCACVGMDVNALLEGGPSAMDL